MPRTTAPAAGDAPPIAAVVVSAPEGTGERRADRRTGAQPRSAPLRRMLAFGRPPRVMGVDVARGVAIVGMIGAHVGVTQAFDWARVETWTDVVHGRSSLLFALVAGISIALLTGGRRTPEVDDLPRIRLGLVGRGAVVFAIGCVLELVGTGIAVVLTVYGILFVAIIPFLRWRRRSLWIAAGALALLGPLLLAIVRILSIDAYGEGIGLVLGTYPVTVWMPFLLAGLAIGRSDLLRLRTAVALLVGGAVLCGIGYGTAALVADPVDALAAASAADEAGRAQPTPEEVAAMPYPEQLAAVADPMRVVSAVVDVAPHSGGTLEILGSGGLAAAIVGAGLLLSRPLRWVLLPLAAMGSMPLTAYAAQIVVIALVGGLSATAAMEGAMWQALTLGLLVAATVWLAFVGTGPLERLTRRASAWMAGTAGGQRAGARVRR